jgi:Tryptophan RNA-binding attenuator protein inhibitory protein
MTNFIDLMHNCQYRANGIQCCSGLLYNSVTLEQILLEGASVNCPACEGRGMIMTAQGRETLGFLVKFGKAQIREIVDELFEERS